MGKVAYAIFFCIVLPAGLVLWASSLSISIAPVSSNYIGYAFSVAGAFLLIAGMLDLYRIGKGLPMNAYPPRNFVTRGSYALVHHPIYTGFCLGCAGVSILMESSAGLYIVTPVIALLCVALVIGYESPDLMKRFGRQKHQVFFGLPENSVEPPELKERLSVFFASFTPWMLLYELFIFLGVGESYIDTTLPFERSWSVVEWMEIFYLTTYAYVGLAPFIIRSKSQLRTFLENSWWCTAIGIFMFFLFPFYASPRMPDNSLLGSIILLEQRLDGASASFPSFHVMWAVVAAMAWSSAFPKVAVMWYSLSLLIAVSCVATGVHSIVDVVAGSIVVAVVYFRKTIWIFLQYRSELLANSWREIMIGKFRIINHSIYAGLAAATGILIAAQFLLSAEVLLLVTFSSIVGGALWGQWLEGSSKLMRPFGYYGALLGGLAGVCLSALVFNQSFLVTCAVFALAAPWTQAIGRLRCLVQGCCHGAVDEHGGGIRYMNDHSRVCKISGLKGKVIHNTQLYSIIGNCLIGCILLRLWYGHASPSLIAGMYFILSGAARFMEEAYRGETQTTIIKGLRLYQWLAIFAIIAGMLITTIHSTEFISFAPVFNMPVGLTTLISGISWAFAMGMDFPHSAIRYSRLTG